MTESNNTEPSGSEIAVVGMAGRFPGARNVGEFWSNLKNGVESVHFFSDDELRASGVPESLLADPRYVKAKALLEDVELFDAEFFGFNPRDAELLDPQQRFFLECAWEALEDAGYDSSRYRRRVGVFAGASMNTYLLLLLSNQSLMASLGAFQVLIASDKDFLATRVSYKLDLTGPSLSVQTACSTSLVAAHLACQSLLNGECDMALAGGVAIRVPQRTGYLYQEGGFLSPDGRCRAFDAEAKGTVSGDGVGIVVLKRLDDAIADRDQIRAIIRGSAINNDGAMKAGFTAPSSEAQAAVIAEAQAMAQVSPDTVTFIEAHGTGTQLGDPIEIAALTEAFRAGTDRKQYCSLASVKTNIGHLDAAAGVAGLIKTVKALEEKMRPASLHFSSPNPKLDLPKSPFFVNNRLTEWSNETGPRRAGVSSFGIGGTNVHLVLEEAPRPEPNDDDNQSQLLVLSARTETALDAAMSRLAAHLSQYADLSLADLAYTLQVGRKQFEHRSTLVCSSVEEARRTLEQRDQNLLLSSQEVSQDSQIAFMFSGQGAQYVNMGRELYRCEPRFREQIDLCASLLRPHLGLNLREALYPESPNEQTSATLDQTFLTQPALFAIEYALARLLMEIGLKPRAMIGHSIGEYVAACLAGVFSLEDALLLVAARGRLIQKLGTGAMLTVPLPESETRSLLGAELSLAAVNSPSVCAVSGPIDAIERLEQQLINKGVQSRRLRTSHAFHSRMMEPAVGELEAEVARVKLNPPTLRYVSNLTGDWITEAEATDPAYWARHMRETVRFAGGLAVLLKGFEGVLLEVGPGHGLTTLAKQQGAYAVASMRAPKVEKSDIEVFLQTLGTLWLKGAPIDWAAFNRNTGGRRVSLPAYPFERKRYWLISDELPGEDRIAASEKNSAPRSVHARPKLANEYVAPNTEVERLLAEVWQELLGTDQVGINDDFFNLGGHSLLATQLITRVNEVFEVEVALHRLFDSPTIAGLSAVVESALIEKVEGLTEEEAEQFLNAQ